MTRTSRTGRTDRTRGPAQGRPANRAETTRPATARRSGPPGRRDPRRPGDLRIPGLPRELHPQEWFAQRLLLTLSGQKPVHWMLGHTVGDAYEQLLALAPGLPLSGPVRPQLTACRASSPAADVIEAHACIAYGPGRRRALAFRLERGPDARWRCAAVEVGPRPGPQEQEREAAP
ncbi:Rv3235 family protein [Streptomyces polyrhachis]|uniref:Rv3235 family protein n=1 Tax=Streptomyces polyrhachis TaxID=1282885 RepID=A0ABW2GGQ9_9ACTN